MKERVAPSHCFIVSHITRSRKLVYLIKYGNLPLKRVRINPAYKHLHKACFLFSVVPVSAPTVI